MDQEMTAKYGGKVAIKDKEPLVSKKKDPISKLIRIYLKKVTSLYLLGKHERRYS